MDDEEYESLVLLKQQTLCRGWREFILFLASFYMEHCERPPRKTFEESIKKLLPKEDREEPEIEEETEEKKPKEEEFKKKLVEEIRKILRGEE